jgi:hypothetical protein
MDGFCAIANQEGSSSNDIAQESNASFQAAAVGASHISRARGSGHESSVTEQLGGLRYAIEQRRSVSTANMAVLNLVTK